MGYQVVIGLEVHAQLSTKTKLFCGCKVEFGNSANTQVCPICLGMPGTLPVPNKVALEYAVKMGLALDATIDSAAMWTRKNYFYPDLPKGYQITQQGGMPLYDRPICSAGGLDIELEDGSSKFIRLRRIHMEEDAGKLIHDINAQDSHFDANRCGTPLIEIVSEPDLRSTREAYLYLEKLKLILEYLEICDANMEMGNLRCDANISLRKSDSDPLGTRVELKNMNSFHNIEKALEVEIALQSEILDAGKQVIQQTKRWDPDLGITIPMRSKEEAHDYRYFPEPDLMRLKVSPAFIAEIRKSLPELPEARRQRYIKGFGLPAYDAAVLTQDKQVADYFDAVCAVASDKKAASNWVMGEVLRVVKETGKSIGEISLNASSLGELLNLIQKGEISGKIAKTVFEEMLRSGKAPKQIVEEKGLKVIDDPSAIDGFIKEILAANPKEVEEYKAGKTKMMGFFVGQVMKKCQGKASPPMVNERLKHLLSE